MSKVTYLGIHTACVLPQEVWPSELTLLNIILPDFLLHFTPPSKPDFDVTERMWCGAEMVRLFALGYDFSIKWALCTGFQP